MVSDISNEKALSSGAFSFSERPASSIPEIPACVIIAVTIRRR
jgi:hypothetical protein